MENHPGLNDALRLSMTALAVAAVFAAPATAGSLINPGEKTLEGDVELTVEGVVAQNRFAGLGAGDGKAHAVSTGGHLVTITGGGNVDGAHYTGITVRETGTSLVLSGSWDVQLEQKTMEGRQSAPIFFGINVVDGLLESDGIVKVNVKTDSLIAVGVSTMEGEASFQGDLMDINVEGGSEYVIGAQNDGGTLTLDSSDIKIIASSSKRADGFFSGNGGTTVFNGRTTIKAVGGQYANAVRPHYSTVTFANDALIEAIADDEAWVVRPLSDEGKTPAVVNFNGNNTVIKGTSEKSVLGVAPSGGKGTAVNFNGRIVSVTVTSGEGLAKALQAQYGSAINMNADIAITATGPEAHGMSVNGYGSSNAMQDGTINVNGSAFVAVKGDKAYGASIISAADSADDNDGIFLNGSTTMNVASEAENGTAVGLYTDNSNVGKARIVVNDADVKASGPNAFGIQAKNKGNVTITGDVKATATGANAVGASLENSTLALTEGASADVTGEKTGIFMDADSSLNAAKATVTTNTMKSAGATTLTNGAVLGVTGGEGTSSTLGRVSAAGSTVELGSGKFTIGEFTGADKTLLLNDVATDVTIENRATDPDGMTLAASGKANDAFVSSQETVDALLDKNLSKNGETIEVQEGLVNDAVTGTVTVDEAGNLTLTDVTVQKNSTVDAFCSVASLMAYQWRHEMNDLTKRMGELRMSPEGVGSWARIYGSTFEYGAQNLTAKNNSVQVGVDATAGAGWTVGAAFSYTDGSTTYDRGEADNEAFGLGVYGTWMHESGRFVDLIAKYGRLSNDFTLAGLEGSFDSNAFSVSAEYGWHLKLSDVAFVEPQAEVSYGRIMGADCTASKGGQSVRFSQDDTEFLITRLGVRSGFYFPKDRGTVYVRASVAHDFKGEVEATAANESGAGRNTAYSDLGGTWLEWGLGANFNLTDRTFAYVDLERTTGAEADEKVRYSLGVRHVW